ncbi:MAG: SRPBCC family protein [Ilumatobacteraceae bacterium]
MKPTDPNKVVSRATVVPSPPGAIFDLLADPRRHCEIDGSGSVVNSQLDAPERLSLGARFGMKMRIVVPYRITNEVVEFEEGRRIAWRHFGGHVWRYILEPVEGGTKVTEQFDWTNNRSPLMLKVMRAQENNAKSIEKTLDNLRARFGG